MTRPLAAKDPEGQLTALRRRVDRLERRPQGGTAPAAITALGQAGSRSQSISGGVLPIYFDFFYRNDPSFGYEQVVSSRARYITISADGYYMAQFAIWWDTDFTAGDQPYLKPMAYIGGFDSSLIPSASAVWDQGFDSINGQQFTAAEMDHHLIHTTVWFNFSAAEFAEPDIGIGMQLEAAVSRTKNFGGQVVITRMGDVQTQVTIV